MQVGVALHGDKAMVLTEFMVRPAVRAVQAALPGVEDQLGQCLALGFVCGWLWQIACGLSYCSTCLRWWRRQGMPA